MYHWHELAELPDSLTCCFEFTDVRYFCINPLNHDELIIAAYPQDSGVNCVPLWFEVYNTLTNEYKDFDDTNINFSSKSYKFINHCNSQQLVSLDFDNYTINILSHDHLQWQKYTLDLKSSYDQSILSSFNPDKSNKFNFCIDDESGLLFIKYGSWKSYLLIVELFDFDFKTIKKNESKQPNPEKQGGITANLNIKSIDKKAIETRATKTGNYQCSIIGNEAVLDVDWKYCCLLGMVYHNDNEIKQKRQKKQKHGKTYQFLLALNGNFKSWIDNLFIIDVTINMIKNDKSTNDKYDHDYVIKMGKNEQLTKILTTSAKKVLHCGDCGEDIDNDLYFEFSSYSYSIYKKCYMIFVGGEWSHESGWSSIDCDKIYYIDLIDCTFHESKVKWCLDYGIDNCCSLLDYNQQFLHVFGGYGYPECSRETLNSHFKIDVKYVIDDLLYNYVVIPWLNQAQRCLNLYIPGDMIRLIQKYVTI